MSCTSCCNISWSRGSLMCFIRLLTSLGTPSIRCLKALCSTWSSKVSPVNTPPPPVHAYITCILKVKKTKTIMHSHYSSLSALPFFFFLLIVRKIIPYLFRVRFNNIIPIRSWCAAFSEFYCIKMSDVMIDGDACAQTVMWYEKLENMMECINN